MITLRPGSQVLKLLAILSYLGEIPMSALRLIGSENTLRPLVQKLTQMQEFRFPDRDERITCKMLIVNGSGKKKTIRLFKAALPILATLIPDGYQYYMKAFNQHHFSGEDQQIERHHRIAEAALVCANAGIQTCPYQVRTLQDETIDRILPDEPTLYLSRELKNIGGQGENKTMFSRIVGAIFYQTGCYAVYNCRNAKMKWNGTGESKVQEYLEMLARWNTGQFEANSCILVGHSYKAALRTLDASKETRRLDLRFDGIYSHIHFIPMDSTGSRLLKILTFPDWNEHLLDMLFDPSDRSYGKCPFEYDAIVNDSYYLSHLDGDIARLIRLRDALPTVDKPITILCFPFQVAMLKEYFGSQVRLKTVELDLIEAGFSQEGS